MGLWQDGLLAALAAVGLASLLWAVVRAVMCARPPRQLGVIAIVTAQGDGEGLEEQVRALGELRRKQGTYGQVLLVNCGLTEEGRRLCGLLAWQDRWVQLCEPEEIGEYLNK